MKPNITIARRFRWAGIVIFAISFVTPQIESGEIGFVLSAKDCGFGAFVATPVFLAILFAHSTGPKDFLCILLVGAAWLNNFSVFARFPASVAWIPIGIPWMFLIAQQLDWIILGHFSTYVPFYPWALGLGLIHTSNYFEPRETYDKWVSNF